MCIQTKRTMAKQLVTVCVFCLLCATHAHASHNHSSQTDLADGASKSRRLHCTACKRAGLEPPSNPDHVHGHRKTRDTDAAMTEDMYHLRRIFAEFGDAGSMSMQFDGFVRMVNSGRLSDQSGSNKPVSERRGALVEEGTNIAPLSNVANTKLWNESLSPAAVAEGNRSDHSRGSHTFKCLTAQDLFSTYSADPHRGNASSISTDTLRRMCPVLLHQLVAPSDRERQEGCVLVPVPTAVPVLQAEDEDQGSKGATLEVWLCATGCIIVVSLCGLLGVVVIPFMQRVFYHQLLQFLVALAVGTLCGDALLHLLPHAMLTADHEHTHSVQHAHAGQSARDKHDANIWKGLIACSGIIFFFFTEKCLTMVAECRKRQQRKRKVPSRVRVMRDADGVGNSTVGEKLCKHKYSSYPYCYGEITTEMTEGDQVRAQFDAEDKHNHAHAHNHTHNHAHGDAVPCCLEELKPPLAAGDGDANETNAELNPSESESYTVIIREHENAHHGHSHTHGHVHSPPKTMSSVAWMVIMGDGLHNFTDGMAIGAAFIANVAGGFSTAIAVFCHELPHEIGDFAVLIKAGMSMKQAVFYNMLSSLLCLFGMVLGVAIGNSGSATPWVFAAAGGMFIYIALVDMIPELTSSHSKEGGSLCQCLLQFLGLVAGVGIMLLIALYEHDLKTVFTPQD